MPPLYLQLALAIAVDKPALLNILDDDNRQPPGCGMSCEDELLFKTSGHLC